MHTQTARAFTVAALLSAAVTTLPAQVQMPAGPTSVGTFSWGYAMTTGGATDFIDNDSFLSFAFEGEHFFKRTMSVGLFFGWTELYERTDETLQIGNGAISGGQYRHANVFPMLVTTRFYPRRGQRDATVSPFIGLGAGAYYTRWFHDVGTLRFEDNPWFVGVTPDLGIVFPNVGESTSIVLSGRYHYPFVNGTWPTGQERDLQFWAITLGIAVSN
jgi:outer membrane protein W